MVNKVREISLFYPFFCAVAYAYYIIASNCIFILSTLLQTLLKSIACKVIFFICVRSYTVKIIFQIHLSIFSTNYFYFKSYRKVGALESTSPLVPTGTELRSYLCCDWKSLCIMQHWGLMLIKPHYYQPIFSIKKDLAFNLLSRMLTHKYVNPGIHYSITASAS